MPLFIGVVALIWLTTVANFGGPSVTGKIGTITVWGVIIPVAGLSIIGWFWFEPSVSCRGVEPERYRRERRDREEHSADVVGLPGDGVRGPECRRGRESAEEPCRWRVCSARSERRSSTFCPTTVIQGIVPNAELAESSAPFATVYAQMFNPFIGNVVMLLAVMACLGLLLGWQFTLSQTAKYTAEERMFPRFFARVSPAGAPIIGMVVAGVLQTAMAFSTMSPNASEQFGKLVSLAAVTNIVPYITSVTALLVVMYAGNVSRHQYQFNTVSILVAVRLQRVCPVRLGKDAVFGGMLVMMVGYLLYGFIASRFAAPQSRRCGLIEPRPAMATA